MPASDLWVCKYKTPQGASGKPKLVGSGGSMVAKLKLKGIDGRAPPEKCENLDAGSGACSNLVRLWTK